MRRSTILAVLTAATVLLMLVSGSAQGTPGTRRGKPGGTTTTTTSTTVQELVSVTVEVKTQDQMEIYNGAATAAGVTVPLPPVTDERSCVVRVEQGASAVTVLDAAVAADCMHSYERGYTNAEWSVPDSYIVCVDETCNQSQGVRWEPQWVAGGGREWTHYFNGNRMRYLEWFSGANDGDVVTLSYQVTGGACVVVYTVFNFHCYDVVQVR